MIRTVIFDIGNVLIRFDNRPFIRRIAKDENAAEKVYDAVWRTGYWNLLDKGEDEKELFEKMIKAGPGYENEIKLVFENIGECMSRCDYAVPWIEALKKRELQVLYLSNYSYHVMKARPDVLDFIPHMDGGVFSCDVRMVKPDPEIYKCICGKYDLDPAECVFLDDRPDNIEAARRFGMKTILFGNYVQGKRELNEIIKKYEGERLN